MQGQPEGNPTIEKSTLTQPSPTTQLKAAEEKLARLRRDCNIDNISAMQAGLIPLDEHRMQEMHADLNTVSGEVFPGQSQDYISQMNQQQIDFRTQLLQPAKPLFGNLGSYGF